MKINKYLEINIQITSKNNFVYLLGNESVKFLEKYENVEYVDISRYMMSEKIKDYKNSFENFSNYENRYSWFTFIRTIIFYEFMKDYNLDKIFSSDSDNVLLKNINKYKFKNNTALCIPTVWEPFYFATSVHAALISREFCKFYEELFLDIFIYKNHNKLVSEKINHHKTNPGSFCDMTFYHMINIDNQIDIDNLLEPVEIGGSKYVFINNFANGEGVLSKQQYKVNRKGMKITKNFELNSNSIYDKSLSEDINIFNIHFQGKHKKYLNKKLLNRLIF